MPRNRVEKLESTVAELESAVEGLTEELVESKERIRVLEEALDTRPPSRVPERRQIAAHGTPEAAPDDVAAATADAEVEATTTGADVDANADGARDGDAPDEAQESRTDDIIVA